MTPGEAQDSSTSIAGLRTTFWVVVYIVATSLVLPFVNLFLDWGWQETIYTLLPYMALSATTNLTVVIPLVFFYRNKHLKDTVARVVRDRLWPSMPYSVQV